MIEQRLQQAAEAMPEPGLDYLAIEEAAKKHRSSPALLRKKRRRVTLILCLSLLLVGCVAGPTVPEYHLYNGSLSLMFPGIGFDILLEETGRDPELDSAKKTAKELGWTIPETLGESPCIGADKYNLTTKESNWFMAMLFHHYTYYSVDYGYEMETEVTREDGTPSTAHWTDADVELTFGSMDNEIWHRQFGFDENDVWTAQSAFLDYIDSDSLEYNGYTLYVGTWQSDDDFYGLSSYYGQRISWVDYDHNTVFQINSRDDTPDFAIQCAKELIDQMH